MSKVMNLAVVMERVPPVSAWAEARWMPRAVIPDPAGGGGMRQIVDDAERPQRLYPGFQVELMRSELEGYYLNVSGPEPKAFVMLRLEGADAEPGLVTLSYNEAARWMDGGGDVEATPLVPELMRWVGQFVEANYHPEPKKMRRKT